MVGFRRYQTILLGAAMRMRGPIPTHPTRRIQFCGPIPAGAVAIGRRHDQGGVVSLLCGGRAPEEFHRVVQSWDAAIEASELSDLVALPFLIAPLLADGLSSAFG
jgi:hypothetical protein